MRSRSRALVTLLVAALVVVAGCPRPLHEGAAGPARVAPDAVAVLRLPRLERAERAAKAWLEGTRGSERSELETMLAFAVRGRSGAALLGLDARGELLISWRPSGEALVYLPVDDDALFSLALDRLLEAQGSSRDDDALGGVRVYRGRDGEVSLLARTSEGGALLWPAPTDVFAAAALLDALASGRVSGRWPTGAEPPPHERAVAELFAAGGGVAALSPTLAALFGGASSLTGARGQLFVDEGAVRLQLSLGLDEAARARVVEQTQGATNAPAGFCALERDALAAARFPVALLRSDAADDGPLDELSGALAIALLPRDGGTPGWIALSRPRGLTGRDALLASVTAAGVVEQRRERVGARTVRVFAAPSTDAPDEATLRVIADEDLFAIAFAAEDALRAIAEGGAPCDEAKGSAEDAAVHLVVEPRALTAALPSAPPGASASAAPFAGGAISALRRLVERLPSGFQRLEVDASLDDSTVVLRASGTLAPRPAASGASANDR